MSSNTSDISAIDIVGDDQGSSHEKHGIASIAAPQGAGQKISSSVTVDFTPDDPGNPQQWPRYRKWSITMLVSLSVFLMPLSSAIVAPALETIKEDLDMPSTQEAVLVLSTFVLTYCLGPFLMGPLSEIFGRVAVLHAGNGFYLIFNIASGFAKTEGQLITFRLLAGIGGSGSLVVGAGIISDCFTKEERGWVIAIYNFQINFGPATGAVVGGYITHYSTWRWAFWATSIFVSALIVLSVIIMKETYPPIILARRMAALQKRNPNTIYHTPYDDKTNKPASELYRIALLRPLHMLRTEPIVQLLTIFYAYIYGLMYLVLSTFSTLWTSPRYSYTQSLSTSSLNFLALGIGYFIGSQICAFTADRIYLALKTRNNNSPCAEARLVLMFPASLFVPAGLLIYGWSAQAGIHWLVSDLGIALFAAGAMISFQATTAYLYEAYTLYAASATGAVYFLRGFTGFGFPLFGPAMYDRLGYGWGDTVLAGVALVVGLPAPALLWRFGERWRTASAFGGVKSGVTASV